MRKFKRMVANAKTRLRDAYRILFRRHYFVFSTDRPVEVAKPEEVYFDIEWREMRRQDIYEIGKLCFGLLEEDDSCQSMLNEANDILNL